MYKLKMSSPLIIAHRGIHYGKHPENSIPALREAFASNLAVEFDVHKTSDGKIILLHDEDLKSTTTGEGEVHDFTFSQLQKFSLVNNSGKITDNKIPTLENILDEYIKSKSSNIINIELKGSNTALETVDIIKKYFDKIPENRFLLSSFKKEEVEIAKHNLEDAYEVNFANLFEASFSDDELKKYSGKNIGVCIANIDAAFAKSCEANDVSLYAWSERKEKTHQNKVEYKKAEIFGISGFFSDFPYEIQKNISLNLP